MTQPHRTGQIIVGLDRSGHDHVVLAAALDHVRHTASAVRVVQAIPPDTATAMAPTDAVTRAAWSADRRARHQTATEDLRRHVTRTTDDLGAHIAIDYDVRHGDPATVLLSSARHADLIVIGTSGTGHRSPFLLGTVSQDIAVHATCPVLLVPTS
ncbi:universal stress protein [Micromonospora purpureochromogenes]|uniref:universal stress protein n=1 Tax=Micromonospora purpureochromogenes TaxID=47872 RepID=UPI00331E7C57